VCTRILWNDNKVAVVASRTMDWPELAEPVLTAFPAGAHHDGGMVAGQLVLDVP
jgi:penicillin V acylase-like amidase (Ntn superfamily)